MKLKALLLAATSLLVASAPGLTAAAERVGDFTLLDQAGYSHSMSWYDDHEAIVFLVQANDSAEADSAVPAFNALKSEFDAQGVEFMMINPMGRKNREAVAAETEVWIAGNINQQLLVTARALSPPTQAVVAGMAAEDGSCSEYHQSLP